VCVVCGLSLCLHFDDDNRFVGCAGAQEQVVQLATRLGECGLAVAHLHHRSGNRGSQSR
jgi:hypothetical protein